MSATIEAAVTEAISVYRMALRIDRRPPVASVAQALQLAAEEAEREGSL